GGVAVLVETVTDNRNRTVAEVRHAFTKAGGNLGTDGSVAYLFDKKGQMSFASDTDEDTLVEAAIEAGADDIETDDDGGIEVTTAPDDFITVMDAIIAAGFEPEAAEVAMVPQTYSALDLDTAEKVLRLLDALEDLDDVQNVYTNADFPPEAMA
ncbi:MAG: YebC/PmpR family DNA-binding transcriptional regulator, partial [Pseudomonadales bacterium]|nr:YebC/PmpR family DNA-binding transcriptional regulator [Pseudomonadales bacterium]